MKMRTILRCLLTGALCGALLMGSLGSVAGGLASVEEAFGTRKIKIACIGDSVTWGVGGTPYPQQLQTLLGTANFEVKNFGISGATAQNNGHDQNKNDPKKFGYRTANPDQGDWNYNDVYQLIYGTQGMTKYQQSLAYEADIYIISIGANDTKTCNWNNGKNDFEKDYKALLEEYMNLPHQPMVIVGTSPAVVKDSYSINGKALKETVVPAQRRIAKDLGLPVIENYDLTNASGYFGDDGVHLNTAGYYAMAKQYADKIKLYAEEPSPVKDLAAKFGKQRIKIGCIGDSVTWGVGGTPYPQQLQQKLGVNFEVKNFGISGATARDDGHDQNVNEGHLFGYRTSNPNQGDWNYADVYQTIYGSAGKTKYQQSLDYQADIYIIAIGGNDAKACNWNNGGENYKQHLYSLVMEYVNLPHKPLVILGTSPGAYQANFGINVDAMINTIVPAQRELAAELGLISVETFEPTVGKKEYFVEDGVHLNTSGYAVVAGKYFEALTELVAGFSSAEVTSFMAGDVEGEVDNDTNSVYLTMPFGTDLSKVNAVYTVGGEQVTITNADMREPYLFTTTSPDGTATREYAVYARMQGKIRVACVGDSVTAGGFPTYVQQTLGETYDVRNFGVNSTTVQTDGKKETDDKRGAYIHHGAYNDSKNFNPDVVFILLGSNDSKQGEGKKEGTYDLVTNWKDGSAEAFERDLKALITSYRELEGKPEVVLVTSPKCFSTAWGAVPAIVNDTIVPLQRKIAEEMDCPLLDVYDLTNKTPSYIGGDGLHPNDNGNKAIAALYSNAVKGMDLAPSESKVTGVAVDKLPTNLVYEYGTEMIDTTGGTIKVLYDDGGSVTYPMRPSMISNFDGELADIQKVSVSLYGFSATFNVAVMSNVIPGDVDGDEQITSTDARLTLQFYA
ncbi:MAG: hypothetical protein J6R77_01930, partial [Clostridia bacterium]|nr:hypothetical protein [Clostridia bacterium]